MSFNLQQTTDLNFVIKQLESVLTSETDLIANLSNMSAILNSVLEDVNWVGFYLLKNNELVLGPFQGSVACTRIALHRGVCGHAATTKQTVIVNNVHEFPGHIACDSATNSEIVVPIMKAGTLFGVLDVDSPVHHRFTETEREFLENAVVVLEKQL